MNTDIQKLLKTLSSVFICVYLWTFVLLLPGIQRLNNLIT